MLPLALLLNAMNQREFTILAQGTAAGGQECPIPHDEELARVFAAHGHKLILVARRKGRLEGRGSLNPAYH